MALNQEKVQKLKGIMIRGDSECHLSIHVYGTFK